MNTRSSFPISRATYVVVLCAIALLPAMAGCNRVRHHAAMPPMGTPPAQASITTPQRQGTPLPDRTTNEPGRMASSNIGVASYALVATLSTQRIPAIKAYAQHCAPTSAQSLIQAALRQQQNTAAVSLCFNYVFENAGPVDESIIDMLKQLLKRKLDLRDETIVHASIGRCYNRMQKYDEAVRYLKEVSARSTSHANTAFAHEFSAVILASYYGLRAHLKKTADKYSIEEYYQALGPYEEGIMAMSSQLGLAHNDQGRDIESEAYKEYDYYITMRAEHQQEFLRSVRELASDKRMNYLSHQKLLRFLALVDEHKMNVAGKHE